MNQDSNVSSQLPPVTFYDRLLKEKIELDERVEKLTAFIKITKDKGVEPFQLTLLNIQEQAMLTYVKVLSERISWLNNPGSGDGV